MEAELIRSRGMMYTASGVPFWPLEPRAEDIRIQDIAHALANLCRFNGHTKEYYSVAQHCVIMARACEATGGDPETCFALLMHDAAEAYMGDMIRPLKHLTFGSTFRVHERELLEVIWGKFEIKLSYDSWIVHYWDEVMLVTEQRDLMAEEASSDGAWFANRMPLEDTIVPVSPRAAKFMFLNEYNDLSIKRLEAAA